MMMRVISTCLLVCLVSGLARAADETELATEKDKISYLIGQQMGGSLAAQELAGEVDPDAICKGLRDALAGKEPVIPEDEAREVMQSFSNRMRQKMMQKRQAQGEENRAEGETFLTTNKEKEGWKETESGLQYKVIEKGEGAKPSLDDVVEVHYRGKLLDGEVFDSSYKRGQPAVFPLDKVIKGWQEALQMMSVGGKWELVIPADLAYGAAGKPPRIGPDAVLRFEVELLDIKEDAQQPGGAQ